MFTQAFSKIVGKAALSLEGLLRPLHDPYSDIKSVLLLEYRLPLGCCVNLTPVFEAMRCDRPDVTITVSTFGLGAHLLRHHSLVDHVIVTPDANDDLLGAARVLRGELRQRHLRPDCIFTGASDQRTRMAVLGMFIGHGWRGGFSLSPELYHRPLKYESELSLIDNNLRLSGLIKASDAHREPRVFFSAADVEMALQLTAEINPQGRPVLIAVTQGSGGQRTAWHTIRFAEVVRFAESELGYAVAYVGVTEDIKTIDAIREVAGVGVSLAGKTSISQLAALLAMSDAVITIDTGTMHLGRAVGVPMVVIGPSWQQPLEWLPIGRTDVRILRGPDRESVPDDYRLDEVRSADVCHALRGLMLEYPPRDEDRRRRVERGVSAVDHLSK